MQANECAACTGRVGQRVFPAKTVVRAVVLGHFTQHAQHAVYRPKGHQWQAGPSTMGQSGEQPENKKVHDLVVLVHPSGYALAGRQHAPKSQRQHCDPQRKKKGWSVYGHVRH